MAISTAVAAFINSTESLLMKYRELATLQPIAKKSLALKQPLLATLQSREYPRSVGSFDVVIPRIRHSTYAWSCWIPVPFKHQFTWKSLCIKFFWSLNCWHSTPMEGFKAGLTVAHLKSFVSCTWQAWLMTRCFLAGGQVTHARLSVTRRALSPNSTSSPYLGVVPNHLSSALLAITHWVMADN